MSSVLLKKGVQALRSNTLNNSLTKFFLSTEKELKNNNNDSQQINENKTKISLIEKIQFFNSKSIEYNHGWKNTNLMVCSKSMNNFFINNETGIETWSKFSNFYRKFFNLTNILR